MKRYLWLDLVFTSIFLFLSLGLLAQDVLIDSEQILPIFQADLCENAEDKRACSQRNIQNFIKENTSYPLALRNQKVKAKAFISCTISALGEIEHVELAKSSGYEHFDKEALRIVSLMTDWFPLFYNAKPMATKVLIPIVFSL